MNNGTTANEACCTCGGGEMSECPSQSDDLVGVEITSEPSVAPSLLVCVDYPEGWHDSGGESFDCNWYAKDESNCQLYGNSLEHNGKTANEACCTCGGGRTSTSSESDDSEIVNSTSEPSEAPSFRDILPSSSTPTIGESDEPSEAPSFLHTLPPSSVPTGVPDGPCSPGCDDYPEGWHDSGGESFDCNWYAKFKNNCQSYGNSFENDGKTANEACCTCGGGRISTCNESDDSEIVDSTSEPSEAPSYSKTFTPSSNPTQLLSQSKAPECSNSPDDWYDSAGPQYDCNWYALSHNCKNYGHKYKNFGKTANQACCICGGGSSPCEDVQGWHDSGGTKYNCEWYSKSLHCIQYGDKYENGGYTANQACCACKHNNKSFKEMYQF